ncbi:hypothetical protein C5167_045874 [Papaver somniferum]|uniref:RING-type domain-containing protein n=1 Tax=Papaver somniferum TaxID=3469 RepID=A0A4Y7LEX8_PAPSO|nr:E3 ubiquitin-protein ligase BIG BROTHER-like isoform X2 [Papaver somniferum]RZC83088.1 hypothetical protein C5167_045874 [Papaver somniferum]
MNRQVEFHYINTGFPYTVTESFMNLFDGLTYSQAEFSFPAPTHDQDFAYWSMQAGSNKFGPSIPGNQYYGYGHPYAVNDLVPRMDEGRRVWENSSVANHEEAEPLVMHVGETFNTNLQSSPEECVRSNHNASSSQIIWQDNVDPDNMTYEELLDLGEAVGTHCRGLSQELISSLPVTKFKCGRFFSRKKSRGERCVICQMEYKKGDRQITLTCKHVYHANCGSKWLSINKACPVCYKEVFGEDSKH